MESFMLTVCMETAVSEQIALWKHSQNHQSKELHLHHQLCERTVHVQACVTI